MRRQSTADWDLAGDIFNELDVDFGDINDRISEERVPERVRERETRNTNLARQLQKYKQILIHPDKTIVSQEVV